MLQLRKSAVRIAVYDGFVLVDSSCFMQHNGKGLCEKGEVLVRGVYGQLSPDGDGAYQKIRVGSLNFFRTAYVEEFRCQNVVGCAEENISPSL
jgi:hypothetical protein